MYYHGHGPTALDRRRAGPWPPLGALLRAARGTRSPAEIAAASGVSLEALRKIETGRVPTPTFFTVAALAHALDDVPLDGLVAAIASSADDAALTA